MSWKKKMEDNTKIFKSLLDQEKVEIILDKKSTMSGGGSKYVITPSLKLPNLEGEGSPMSRTLNKTWILKKGYLYPKSYVDLISQLIAYINKRLNMRLPIESKQLSLTMFNVRGTTLKSCNKMCKKVYAKYLKSIETNSKELEPLDMFLCCPSWRIRGLHFNQDGILNEKVFEEPWYSLEITKSRLSEIYGEINSCFVSPITGIKLWLNVKCGIISPSQSSVEQDLDDSVAALNYKWSEKDSDEEEEDNNIDSFIKEL